MGSMNFDQNVYADVANPAAMPRKASPPAEGAAYTYNPYDTQNCRYEVPSQYNTPAAYDAYGNYAAAAPADEYPAADQQEDPARDTAVLHPQLQGYVTFIPYPSDSHPVPEQDMPREQLTRVFLGQLPYRVTHMQLAWLCDTIAPGTALFGIETIMKKTGMKGKRLPTGCIHALTRPEHVDYLIACLSHRVLFDDCGIWFAQNADEQAQLQSYCDMMKHNEHMRFRDRPYQPVVVQMATSNYGNRQMTATSTPPRRFSPASSVTSSPPPSPAMGNANYGYPVSQNWGPY